MSGAVQVGSPSNCGLALRTAALEMQAGLEQLRPPHYLPHTGTQLAGVLRDAIQCGGRGGWGHGERSGGSVSVSAWQQCRWPLSRLWPGQREFSNKGRRGDSLLGGGEQGTVWLGWQEGLLLGKSESSYKGLRLVDSFHLKSGASLQEQDPHQHES